MAQVERNEACKTLLKALFRWYKMTKDDEEDDNEFDWNSVWKLVVKEDLEKILKDDVELKTWLDEELLWDF